VQAASLIDGFDYALWMDADNHLVADCCEDLLGTLVALRHGWSYSSGMSAALLRSRSFADTGVLQHTTPVERRLCGFTVGGVLDS